MAFYSLLFLVRNLPDFSDVNKFTEFVLWSSWSDFFVDLSLSPWIPHCTGAAPS